MFLPEQLRGGFIMKLKKENICTILAICFMGAFFTELYFFKTAPDAVAYIAGGLAVLLVLTYLLVANLISMRKEWEDAKADKQDALLEQLMEQLSKHKEDRTEQTLANMEKFEKAIYVAIQQHTSKMADDLNQVSEAIVNGSSSLDFTIETQMSQMLEKIDALADRNAKIDVKYGRENTKSLMVFQKKAFDNIVLAMEELAKEFSSSNEQTQQKLMELQQTMKNLSVSVPADSSSDITASEIPTPVAVSEEIPDIDVTMDEVPDMEIPSEAIVEPEVEPIIEPEPEVIPDPIAELEPTPEPAPVNDDPNHVMTPEEIAALVAGSSAPEPEPIPEPEPTPEPAPVNDDPNHVMTPEEIAALIAGSSAPEPEPIPELEPTPKPTPVNDDPNHVMTPEEIAALVAGSSAPEPEPLPEPTPVNDDPNHVMTPEEIAALIAGTN